MYDVPISVHYAGGCCNYSELSVYSNYLGWFMYLSIKIIFYVKFGGSLISRLDDVPTFYTFIYSKLSVKIQF